MTTQAYAAVIEELSGDNRKARVRQVDAVEAGGWPILSGRCHIRVGEGFSEPRLGFFVQSQLRAPYLLVMTRQGERITVCEVQTDRIPIGTGPSIDVPVNRAITIHQSIISALNGMLIGHHT